MVSGRRRTGKYGNVWSSKTHSFVSGAPRSVPGLRRPGKRAGKPGRFRTLPTRGVGLGGGSGGITVVHPTMPGGWRLGQMPTAWRNQYNGRHYRGERKRFNNRWYYRERPGWQPVNRGTRPGGPQGGTPKRPRPDDPEDDAEDMDVAPSGDTGVLANTGMVLAGGSSMPSRYSRRTKRRRPTAGAARRIPQGELKFIDKSLSATALTAPTNAAGAEVNPTGAGECMNGVAQGNGDTQRVGMSIMPHSIHLKGKITVGPRSAQAALDIVPEILVALVLDKNCNGLEAKSEDVYTNVTATGSSATDVFPNLRFRQKFRILKVLKFKLPAPQVTADGATASLATAGVHTPFEMYVSLRSLGKLVYNGNGGTFSSMQSNALNLVAYTSNTGLGASIHYAARFRYYDR